MVGWHNLNKSWTPAHAGHQLNDKCHSQQYFLSYSDQELLSKFHAMALILTVLLLGAGAAFFPVLFSRLLLNFPNPMRFNLFLAYVGLTIFVSCIYSAFALCIFTLLGRHDLAQHTTSRLWWYITAPVTGIKLEIEDEEKLKGWGGKSTKGPCVFVINHQSEIDVLLASRVRFVRWWNWEILRIDIGPALATSHGLVCGVESEQNADFWALYEVMSNGFCGSAERFRSH
jgi:hypothetical protein